MSDSVGVGSLEAASKLFNGIDTKDISHGIKGCISLSNQIEYVENVKNRNEQMKKPGHIDIEILTEEIRSDMGDERLPGNIDDKDKDKGLER